MSCSIASMTAATACPAVFRTRAFPAPSTPFWARKTATSTAPRRSGGFSGSFSERFNLRKKSLRCPGVHLAHERFPAGHHSNDRIQLVGWRRASAAPFGFHRETSSKRKVVNCPDHPINFTQEFVGGHAPCRARVVSPKTVNVI